MSYTDSTEERLLEIVGALVRDVHPADLLEVQIHLDSELDRDLGLDSLARMELLSRLEKEFPVRFPEKILIIAETPRDLLRYLKSRPEPPADSGEAREAPEIPSASPEAGGEEQGGRYLLDFKSAESLPEVLHGYARSQAGVVHITLLDDEKEVDISYGELWQESLRVASGLLGAGLERGDTVAIMLPTSADYFFCFMGVMLAGGIPVPLYPPARPTQIEEHVRRHRKILANAGSKILITVREVRPVARLLKSQVPELARIVVADELRGEKSVPPARPQSTDIAFLQYTSGSTGDPKGVVLSHGNLLANIAAMGRICRVTVEDRFVSWLPLYHDMGLIGAWFGSMCHCCRLVVMSPLTFLARPVRWLRAIDTYGGTLSASPNFGYEICATRVPEEDLAGLDLSRWRLAFNGAEPVLPATLKRFAKRFSRYGFPEKALAPVYGLAESTVGLAFPEPGIGFRIDRIERELFATKGMAEQVSAENQQALEFVCCGRPLPGHELRVVDDDDRELPERQQGRLQFKGPSSTSGYYRNSAESKKLFCGRWLETGDLAYMAGGELYLTSRQKDMIIRAGRNIYPHELEEAVGEIEGLRKGCTAVFASVEDESGQEKMVVLAESRITDEARLRSLKTEIVNVTMDLIGLPPDEILIAPPGTVLKTSSGKIRRAASRMLYESGNVGRKKSAAWLQLVRMAWAGLLPTIARGIRKVLTAVYACYCWLILCLTGAVVWCLMMVLPAGKPAWNVASKAVKLVLKLTNIRARLHDPENWPVGEKFLVVSNHASYLDSIILTGLLPEPCNYVGKAELGKNWFLRMGLKKLRVHLVERFDASKGVADAGAIAKAIEEGSKPLFFAEGTLQRMPGLLPFQLGAFVLAGEEGLPIVPIVIQGTRNILRGGTWYPRHGSIRVTVCKPVSTAKRDWEGAMDLKDRVREAMLQILEEPDLAGEYRSLTQLKQQRRQEAEKEASG